MKSKAVFLLLIAGFLVLCACSNPIIERVYNLLDGEIEEPPPDISVGIPPEIPPEVPPEIPPEIPPAITYTVTFNSNGGSPVDSQDITEGDTASRPTDPNRNYGYIFDDWYANDELTTLFDFSSNITTNTTVYARWKIEGMAWIPAGTFTMGSPVSEAGRQNDETPHQVTLTANFYMGIYPVTQTRYEAVMGSNPSWFCLGSGGTGATLVAGLDTADFPVERVSWYDALVFCNKLSILEGLIPAYTMYRSDAPSANYAVDYWTDIPENWSTDPDYWGAVPPNSSARWNTVRMVEASNGYRLPTEAQWEYACRAGTTTAYNWGTDTINLTQANYNQELIRTTTVGSYASNTWGLFDMHGNVWEWCGDWYGPYTSEVQTDPTGVDPGSNRVKRGGSMGIEGEWLRSAMRECEAPTHNKSSGTGFRLVRPN